MMTREEAKKKICPTREFTATFAFHNGYITDGEDLECESRCLAEDCPKWRDGEESMDFPNEFVVQYCKKPCEKYWKVARHNATGHAIIKLKINHCNKCPKRFGYCGG